MPQYLDFEKPIAEIEGKIEELKNLSLERIDDITLQSEIDSLKQKVVSWLDKMYGNLEPWQKVQVARHVDRPKAMDYIQNLFQDVVLLSGDRYFAEDASIVAGMANFHQMPVLFLAQEKGNDLDSRRRHNFGMPRPEGYRKCVRIMEMADRFNIPVISFVDTPGAYPGLDAEERGQAEAIANSIATLLRVKSPTVSVVIGEGGSGGAIAIAATDRVMMLEHSVYSVISPEGCASILFRDSNMSAVAAKNLKITAQDLKSMGIIHEIIPEPLGGAHRNHAIVMDNLDRALLKNIKYLLSLEPSKRLQARENFFSQMSGA